ncbi:MAG: hypothetical protein ACOC6R_03865 [Chloroflexota bacterium]
MMEYHFGYNCKHYLPTLNKCRVLIDNYRRRAQLVEQKWLSTRDLLIYLNLPKEELIEQIAIGEIKTRLPKGGKVMFRVSSAWQWDNCPLASDGGQCFYFEPHDGKKIACLIELKGLEAEHPNLKNMPSEEDIRTFERKVIEAMGGPKHA